VLVPKRSGDGNAHSGVELPDIAVPIASHGFMNAPLAMLACPLAALSDGKMEALIHFMEGGDP